MPAQNQPGLVLDRAHPLTRGLVGWWPMNEGGGGQAKDVSGSANPATLTNISPSSTSGWAGGPSGRSLMFDATDDYLSVTSSKAISTDLLGDMTWAMWVKIVNFSNHIWLLSKGSGTFADSYNCFLLITTGIVYHRRANGTAAEQDVTSTRAPPLGQWCHIAATERNRVVTHYLNGAPNGSATLSAGSTSDSGNVLRIGARSDGFYMNGQMAHVRLYSRALSAVEVGQLYADPLAGARLPSNPRRYYVAPAISPPAAIAAPPTADRLWNRGYVGRIFRRGERGS